MAIFLIRHILQVSNIKYQKIITPEVLQLRMLPRQFRWNEMTNQ